MTSKVPIYGNYHGYYSKRPPAISDARLHHLPPDIFINARVLDVGCNEGWITCEIAQNWGAKKVVGVDIDESLIEGAWRRRRALWSSQGPSSPSSTSTSTPQELEAPSSELGVRRKRSRSKVDSDDDDGPSPAPRRSHNSNSNYFPASCEHEFGSLPIPPANPSDPSRGKNVFPHNVTFVKADWVDEDIVEDRIEDGWDVVVAFSISKWIHLNKGDTGLLAFFHKVFRVLHAGGTFILEPQPWDSYAKAKRMDGRLKENARNLSLRPNLQKEGEGGEKDGDEEEEKLKSFEEVLVNEVGFKKLKRIEGSQDLSIFQYNYESRDYTYETKERGAQENSKTAGHDHMLPRCNNLDLGNNLGANGCCCDLTQCLHILNRDKFDPHVQIHFLQEPTLTKSKPTEKQGAKIAMKYIYEFPDKVNGSRFFSITDSSISDYHTVAVAGRKTRVLKVIEVEKRGTSWREKEGTANRTERRSFCEKPGRKSDDHLQFFADPEAAGIIQAFKAELQDGKYKNLALLVKAELTGHPSKEVSRDARPADPLPASLTELMTATGDGIRIPSLQTFQVTNPSQDEVKKPEYRKFAPKKRCFHLFADECTPVDYLPTVDNAFSVLGQCVIALRLMFCAGWVHRDISAGNVMAVQDGNGC
ncbi:hypothetical protein EST38_g5252 [Candolleomyces aberdarensis]|uniref:RNA methyltransferase n=1 Tax=Candolleomyces aberdarensis TaxID=2316362 RepID=A0A4V1Q424_9AGAR|nr:hypothetical protein EST38_g5252 [Candolleomyces aberdarensis]